MQLEINVTGNKVRFLVNGRLSRWYNGTEFAAIRNLVRSAEQVEAWIKQEEGKRVSIPSIEDIQNRIQKIVGDIYKVNYSGEILNIHNNEMNMNARLFLEDAISLNDNEIKTRIVEPMFLAARGLIK